MCMKYKTGIDLQQFRKYIIENYEERCKERSWGCALCDVWELYDDIEAFLKHNDKHNDILEKMK